MSDAYGTALVDRGETGYEQFAMGVVTGALAAVLLAAGALFGWVPVAGEVGPAPAATYFGGGLFVLALATGLLGGLSRWGAARTTPDRSPGPVVGLTHLLLWGMAAGLLASNTAGLGALGWLVALPAGAVAALLAVRVEEDAGATLPTAAFVCFVAVAILSGTLSPGWAWEPEAFGASFPGTLVIPLLTMLCGLLVGWTGASAHAGFGARGRQNGAFLLISLLVVLVLSVLGFLLVFVFERGLVALMENLSVGAGTALLVLGTALALLLRFWTVRPALADGTDKIRSFVALAVALALALAVTALVATIVTGRSLSGYAVTIEPTATVGAVPGALVGTALLVAFRRSWRSSGADTRRARRLAATLRLCVVLPGVAAAVEFALGSPLVLGPVAVVPAVASAAGGLGVVLLVLRAGTWLSGSVPAWLPSLSRTGLLVLWAFVIACVHVAVTGNALGGGVGIVAGGSLDWPFVMNPSQGLGIQQGVMPAMLGTVWLVIGAVVFAVPLAVGAAVFLTEYAEDSLFTRAVDIATNGLWSTPSIVFGLFGLAFLVPRFGGSPSIFAAQLVLGFMLLPLVLITSREAMKSVPDEYRDASAALGVSKWDTIRSVVIPAAIPGITTGAILGVGRIAGETAPLLLVLNGPNFPTSAPGVLSSFTFSVGAEPPFLQVSNPALLERASALPYQLYAVITAGVGADDPFGWGTALVLLGVVLWFFAMGVATRRYFRRKLHQ